MVDVVVPTVVLDKPLEIDELTQATLEGTGVFDVMMRSVKGHLEGEFKANRIRGADYANVYLGSLTAVLGQASAYALSRVRLGLELQQMQIQVDQLRANLEKHPYEIALLQGQAQAQDAQTALATKQLEQLTEEIKKIPVEVTLLNSQVNQAKGQLALTEAQTAQVVAENLRAPKQLELLTAQVSGAVAQTNVTTEQLKQITADVARTTQETANLVVQGTNLTAQVAQTKAQTDVVVANLAKVPLEIAGLEAQNIIATKQALKLEKDMALQVLQLDIEQMQLDLSREELKLKGQQLLLLKSQVDGQKYQTDLAAQKVITEKAQTQGSVIGTGSVLYIQNKLYEAQTLGYQRDAEQKIAKMLIDTWSVRRSNDDGVVADAVNHLNDATIGAAVQAALAGINVSPVAV